FYKRESVIRTVGHRHTFTSVFCPVGGGGGIPRPNRPSVRLARRGSVRRCRALFRQIAESQRGVRLDAGTNDPCPRQAIPPPRQSPFKILFYKVFFDRFRGGMTPRAATMTANRKQPAHETPTRPAFGRR